MVVDTSRRQLFEGVGAFRIGTDMVIRGMSLVEPASNEKSAVYDISSRKHPMSSRRLHITDDQLGGTIDLLGEVIHAGRLRAEGEVMRR